LIHVWCTLPVMSYPVHRVLGSSKHHSFIRFSLLFPFSTCPTFGVSRWGVADLAAVQRPIRELAHADPATGKLVRGSPGYPQLPRCVAEALWSDPTHSDADAHKVKMNERFRATREKKV